jgi:hypothetical protein
MESRRLRSLLYGIVWTGLLGLPVGAQCYQNDFGLLLGTGDDVAFGPQFMNLAFPMGGVASSYNTIQIQTNGVAYLSNNGAVAVGATQTGYSTLASTMASRLSGTIGEAPRIAPYWRDLVVDQANNGGVWLNTTIPGVCVVTWANCVHYGTTSPVFTLQAQLHDNGTVQMFFSQTTQTVSPTPITGISVGNGTADPGPIDLSNGSVGSTAGMAYETFSTAGSFDLRLTEVAFVPNAVGGYDVLSSPCMPANHQSYGAGCTQQSIAFYETFSTLTSDLDGNSLSMTPNAGGGYDVTMQPLTNFQPPTSVGLALGDDTTATVRLPFTFDFPGGSTTDLTIDSNGRIHLASTGGSDFSNTPGELIGAADGLLCPAWQDMVCDGSVNVSNVYFEQTSPTEVAVTWWNVPCWPAATGGRNTFQVVLVDNGTLDHLEFRYVDINDTNGTGNITGYTPGGAALDPGSSDLTLGLMTMQQERAPLALSGSSTPVMGMPVTYTVDNIRSGGLTVIGVSFFATTPLSVANIGLDAPGCFVHIDPINFQFFGSLMFGGPSRSQMAILPTHPLWAGARIYLQAASLSPTDNPAGFIFSNALSSFLQTF